MRFIQFSPFSKNWSGLGLMDDDLRTLELLLLEDPRRGPVIPGTNGLRKLRFAGKDSSRGKRGGYRICYVHYERFHVVALVIVYDKTETSDLSPVDKKVLNSMIRLFQEDLERGI